VGFGAVEIMYSVVQSSNKHTRCYLAVLHQHHGLSRYRYRRPTGLNSDILRAWSLTKYVKALQARFTGTDLLFRRLRVAPTTHCYVCSTLVVSMQFAVFIMRAHFEEYISKW